MEINKALSKGYRMLEIYEVHHFEKSSTELWKSYIGKFLKIKLETSPYSCSTDEYISKARQLDIELKPEDLKPNPGLRYISKLCLNSLWGKFGQDQHREEKRYINNPCEYYKLVTNTKIEDLSLSFLQIDKISKTEPNFITEDTVVYATYKTKLQYTPLSYATNIYTACFTTAYARMRLYDMLDKLGDDVMYCDTDSIIYNEDDNTRNIVDIYIGDSLGEWTDELNGNHITFFTSMAPKDYGYITSNGKQVSKTKGFRLNAESEDKMTVDMRCKLITPQQSCTL